MAHTPTGITPPTPGLSHEEPELAQEADIPTETDPEPVHNKVKDPDKSGPHEPTERRSEHPKEK